MAEPRFQTDDDLPRTFRREREAREREARERDAAMAAHAGGPQSGVGPHDFGPPSQDYSGPAPDALLAAGLSGTVTRFEVPFLHLVVFFLKAVVAAIPALILLTLILYAGGKVLESYFPALRHFEIKIQPVGAGSPAPVPTPATVKPAPPAKK